jgi:hypothetical protein
MVMEAAYWRWNRKGHKMINMRVLSRRLLSSRLSSSPRWSVSSWVTATLANYAMSERLATLGAR